MNEKLRALTQGARFDLSCACGPTAETARKRLSDRWIYPAVLPDGKKIFLFKVLFTNLCLNDCFYCENRRANREMPRYSFTPEELVRTFLQLLSKRAVQGLFLSSALSDTPSKIMEKMLLVVETLRLKHRFFGYLHLKILPGVETAMLKRAMELASRVSLNLECPTPETLKQLCPEKDFENQLLMPIKTISKLQESGNYLSDQTTQFVVGATGEKDSEILARTASLYSELRLSRVYYSAFNPPPGKLWDGLLPVSPWREIRLYQADFLLRKYRFSFLDLVFNQQNNLPLKTDPKMLWAVSHPEKFPVEINQAPKYQLLQVPGIGPRSVNRIIKQRKEGRITELTHLQKMGVVSKRAAPYILLNGKAPLKAVQLNLELPLPLAY